MNDDNEVNVAPEEYQEGMASAVVKDDDMRKLIKSSKWIVLFFVILAVAWTGSLVKMVTVKGSYMGVQESWVSGVLEEPLAPRTYLLFPGFVYNIYQYDMSARIFVMNDRPSLTERFAEGRELDSYLVQSKEGQDMKVSLNVRWRIDPEYLVKLHRTVRSDFEEKLLRPELLRVVKDNATVLEAIKAYSGEGLVTLQNVIQTQLRSANSELARQGIIIENFVIETIELDKEYIGEIKSRQVAVQREIRAKAEEKAALAEAQRAKAVAQADYERAIVNAQRDKEVGILDYKKRAEQEVLQAEAAKRKVVLGAEAEKESGELRAQAIKAIGAAEAEAKKMALSAYAVPGADNFVRVEVAKNMAEAFKNISGYLPSDLKVNLLSNSFLEAVQAVIGQPKTGEVK